MRRSVLGIDAAWTEKHPSGVALVEETAAGPWRLVRVEASYEHFLAGASEARGKPAGSRPDPQALLDTCEHLLGGRKPDLVAVDMPLSLDRIDGRRVSDNCISRVYGARKAGTHTPSKERPGTISDRLREEFCRRGYRLQVKPYATPPGLIEVYPHPALIELMRADQRLKYKYSRARKFWPDPAERKEQLLARWTKIADALDCEIDGVKEALTPQLGNAGPAEFKAHEDKLDAVVCAWVGICVLEGCARPFGDEVSTIWAPTPRAEVDPGYPAFIEWSSDLDDKAYRAL